ncbi:MAG: UPF0262 family protein [Rhodobacteraceae bacterium]|nr:UPF0262 family protein [Paracoccaceae bacterium]
MSSTNRLCSIRIDDSDLPAPSPEVSQERKVAIFDLLENNRFELADRDGQKMQEGPYSLVISIWDGRLVFDVGSSDGTTIVKFYLSLAPMRQTMKDYFAICSSYYNAVKKLPRAQIETVDMARRGIHNEGARSLRRRLKGKIDVDTATAKRLFTLVCALQPRR